LKHIDKGIFLHRLSYSESSLIVRFYTFEHGTQSYLFKGAKKKKGINLMPLNTYEISYYGAPNTLQQLTSAQGENLSGNSQFDIPKTGITFFMAELLDQCLHDSPRDEDMFNFIQTEINWLNASSEFTNYPIWFLLEVSKQLGFYPSLEGEKDTFNVREGTVGINYQALPELIHHNSITVLRQALISEKEEFLALEIPKNERLSLISHLLLFYKLHQSNFRGLKSLDILQEVLA
jgi:DNA repair protein RecO (recombination protein O)